MVTAAALTPRLLADLEPRQFDGGSQPGTFATAGGYTYFFATDSQLGRLLWRTDGTPGGTRRVAGACNAGCGDAASSFIGGDRLFILSADDRGGLSSLKVTSGRRARRLTEGLFEYGGPGHFDPVRQLLYVALFRSGQWSFWRSDGTESGTFPLGEDFELRLASDGAQALVASISGLTFFEAVGRNLPTRVWRTDGTRAGTFPLRTSASASQLALTWAPLGRRLLFNGWPDGGLWLTDDRGETLSPVPAAWSPLGILQVHGALNGLAYFQVVSENLPDRTELWVTDGTGGGTKRIAEGLAAVAGVGNGLLFSIGNRALFHMAEALWTTDGTPEGTAALADGCPVPCVDFIGWLGTAGGRALFALANEAGDNVILSTDGLPGTTRVLGSIPRFPVGMLREPNRLTLLLSFAGLEVWETDGLLLRRIGQIPSFEYDASNLIRQAFLTKPDGQRGFVTARETPESGSEPWFLPLTGEPGAQLRNVFTTQLGFSSYPKRFMRLDQQVVFFARDPEGLALWRTDGHFALDKIHAFPPDSQNPQDIRTCGTADRGRLFFRYGEHKGDVGLWWTDGRQSRRVAVPTELRATPPCEASAAVGKWLYFTALGEGGGDEIWMTDGSPKGLREAVNLGGSVAVHSLVSFRQRLYFISSDPLASLWSLDQLGTLRRVSPPGMQVNSPPIPVRDRLFFTVAGLPYVTDGLAAPVALPVPSRSRVGGFAEGPHGSYLFDTSNDGLENRLWISDGTARGTRDLGPLPRIQPTLRGGVVGGKALFIARAAGGEATFWETDGTAAGTRQSVARLPASAGRPGALVGFGDRWLVWTELRQLWETDGTAAGTRLVSDRLGANLDFDGTPDAGLAGQRLVFSLGDPATGFEPWVLDPR